MARPRSPSAKTMLPDLPPSSRMQGTTLRAAVAAMADPAVAEPTNTTRAVFGGATAYWPDVRPTPAMTFPRPSGAPARSQRTPRTRDVSGVSSDGFRTTALPAQMAGAICQPAVFNGAFQGVICTTAP